MLLELTKHNDLATLENLKTLSVATLRLRRWKQMKKINILKELET